MNDHVSSWDAKDKMNYLKHAKIQFELRKTIEFLLVLDTMKFSLKLRSKYDMASNELT